MNTEKATGLFCTALTRCIEKEVEKNTSKWPPRCMGFFHQPKRPKENIETR